MAGAGDGLEVGDTPKARQRVVAIRGPAKGHRRPGTGHTAFMEKNTYREI